jgi:hypothetical protein
VSPEAGCAGARCGVLWDAVSIRISTSRQGHTHQTIVQLRRGGHHLARGFLQQLFHEALGRQVAVDGARAGREQARQQLRCPARGVRGRVREVPQRARGRLGVRRVVRGGPGFREERRHHLCTRDVREMNPTACNAEPACPRLPTAMLVCLGGHGRVRCVPTPREPFIEARLKGSSRSHDGLRAMHTCVDAIAPCTPVSSSASWWLTHCSSKNSRAATVDGHAITPAHLKHTGDERRERESSPHSDSRLETTAVKCIMYSQSEGGSSLDGSG